MTSKWVINMLLCYSIEWSTFVSYFMMVINGLPLHKSGQMDHFMIKCPKHSQGKKKEEREREKKEAQADPAQSTAVVVVVAAAQAEQQIDH